MRKVSLAESKTLLSAALLMVTTLLGTGTAAGQESGSDTFNDVPAGHWADQAIGWAVANDITRGAAADRFDPDGTGTRAQIVTFLYRTFHLIQGNPVTADATEGTVAFSSNRDGDHEVYLMNSDGSNVRQLTHNTRRYDWLPAWSPDATRIAFTSDRDGDFEIFTMKADGTNQHQLTHNHRYDLAPSWSPDGAQIAFTRDLETGAEVFLMNSNGGNQQRLTFNDHHQAALPSWSPDGTRIAFNRYLDRDADVFVMNADGSNRRQISDNDHQDWISTAAWSSYIPSTGSDLFSDVPEGHWAEEEIGWAVTNGIITGTGEGAFDPDGTVSRSEIVTSIYDTVNLLADHQTDWVGWNTSPTMTSGLVAFSSNRDGDWEIFVMNPDGTNLRQLTHNHRYDRDPSWSPDGAQIAFTSSRDGDEEIFLMNADGTDQRQLTSNHHADSAPSWSPDGTQITFSGNDDVNLQPDDSGDPQNGSRNDTGEAQGDDPGQFSDWEVFRVDVDRTNLRQLTYNNNHDWAPSWSPDGAQIAFQRWGDGNYDVYLMNADGTAQRKLTNKRGSDFFDDVPEGHRANETIGWAATYGITSGVSQSRFAPDGTVTRAQIVTFLHRMVNLAQSTRPPS